MSDATKKSKKRKKKLNTIQSLASQSSKYWATMRSNLNLMSKSERHLEQHINLLREELSDILDSGIITYPHTLKQIGIKPDHTYKEKRDILKLRTFEPNHTVNELKFIRDIAYKAQNIRKANWAWRIGQEAEEKQLLGWHPFFVTLTIDPILVDEPKKLWTDGREFRKYIRSLANVVCREMGHPPSHKPPYRPESDYITYAAVIEHGKSREHHHCHAIIWLKQIPSSWSTCPNAGVRNPAARTRNECLPMRTYWKWSQPQLSPSLYFRSIGDIWETKHNFVLPINPKTEQPMKVSTARTAGNYITKYLTKEHKEWHHRMKATRNLGMKKLRDVIMLMDPSIVEALTMRPENSQLNCSLIKTNSVPQGLIRLEAKQRNYLTKYRRNQLDLTTLLQSNLGMFSKMLTSVRDGARPDRMDSSEYFDWVGRLLPAQKGYSKGKLIAANVALGISFPPLQKIANHVKLGANESGYT